MSDEAQTIAEPDAVAQDASVVDPAPEGAENETPALEAPEASETPETSETPEAAAPGDAPPALSEPLAEKVADTTIAYWKEHEPEEHPPGSIPYVRRGIAAGPVDHPRTRRG